MHRTVFHQANYTSGQFIPKVQNVQQLVSRALESTPPNKTDQVYIPQPSPLVASVANATIRANDTL